MPILTPGVIKVAADTTLLISRLASSKEKTAALARHIEESDVFLGIVHTPNGRHEILVKGKRFLERIVADDTPRTARTGGIFVTCDEEALAMRLVFGDGEDEELQVTRLTTHASAMAGAQELAFTNAEGASE